MRSVRSCTSRWLSDPFLAKLIGVFGNSQREDVLGIGREDFIAMVAQQPVAEVIFDVRHGGIRVEQLQQIGQVVGDFIGPIAILLGELYVGLGLDHGVARQAHFDAGEHCQAISAADRLARSGQHLLDDSGDRDLQFQTPGRVVADPAGDAASFLNRATLDRRGVQVGSFQFGRQADRRSIRWEFERRPGLCRLVCERRPFRSRAQQPQHDRNGCDQQGSPTEQQPGERTTAPTHAQTNFARARNFSTKPLLERNTGRLKRVNLTAQNRSCEDRREHSRRA